LDIGTYVGTSALCFALAVGRGGHVVTLDVKDANADDGFWKVDGRSQRPRDLMERAQVSERVDFFTESGLNYLRRTDTMFDFVCIDAGKNKQEDYEVVRLALSRLNPDGLIFMDDVFPHNRPIRPGGFSEPGPWLVLERLRREMKITVHQFNRTIEGAEIRCAFITEIA
jgi:predicted O-methyltransferase YrrM